MARDGSRAPLKNVPDLMKMKFFLESHYKVDFLLDY